MGIILFSVMLSMVKGFARELVSLGALVCGYLLASRLYPLGAQRLAPYARTPDVAAFTAFLGILVLAVVAGGFLSRLAGKLVEKAGLRWFDRLLGAGFGLVRGVLMCVILVLALLAFSANPQPLARSRLAPLLIEGARVVVSLAPPEMRARFSAGLKRVQKAWEGRMPS